MSYFVIYCQFNEWIVASGFSAPEVALGFANDIMNDAIEGEDTDEMLIATLRPDGTMSVGRWLDFEP